MKFATDILSFMKSTVTSQQVFKVPKLSMTVVQSFNVDGRYEFLHTSNKVRTDLAAFTAR